MANSVTARFNDDCKVFVSMSDDTTVEKAVIIDAEGNETDIGGGGGSSDFSIAQVTVSIIEPGIEEPYYPENIACIGINDRIIIESFNNAATYPMILYKGSEEIYTDTNTFVSCSGDATYEIEDTDIIITITGDCAITLKGGNIG